MRVRTGLKANDLGGNRVMFIRPAEKRDAVEAANLIHLAIKDIAETLTGEKEETKIRQVLAQLFTEERNRLSFQNCLVATTDQAIMGIIIIYSGADAQMLDKPIIDRLKQLGEEKEIVIDKEAELEDYYIDTVCVNPDYQGKRIGTHLIQAAEKLASEKGFNRISLNVAKDNPKACQLYTRLGYKKEQVIQINGHDYDYMVKIID